MSSPIFLPFQSQVSHIYVQHRPGLKHTLAAVLKSSPTEFAAFRQETLVKFPTFTAPPLVELPADKLAAALIPIPARPHYHHNPDEDIPGMPQRFPTSNGPQPPQPATPAPTPPQSPKPKKQQYQTDQTRPFLFPYSRIRGQTRLVPFAIEEADRLYSKHMHVSLALYQMWRTREDCILDESGLQSLPASISGDLGPGGSSMIDRKFSIVSLPSTSFSHIHYPPNESNEDEPEVALPDMVLLQDALREAEDMIKAAEQGGSRTERRKAKERREDIVRLMRVETLYVSRSACIELGADYFQILESDASPIRRLGCRSAEASPGHCQRTRTESHFGQPKSISWRCGLLVILFSSLRT